MSKVKMNIDGHEVTVEAGTTILKAARQAGIKIPTLCYLEGVNNGGNCRVCLVEVKNRRNLAAACVTPVEEGLEIVTQNQRVREARKTNLELILSNHDCNCLTCNRSGNCELQSLAKEMRVDERAYEGERTHHPIDRSSFSIVRDPNKCILCRRCIEMCGSIQKNDVLGVANRGFDTVVGNVFDYNMEDTACIGCGQCIMVCPVNALTEKDDTARVYGCIEDPLQYTVVQVAPAVRAALGECFGLPPGVNVEGRMVSALKRMGFDKVFDVNYGADLTIMEEANELITRIQEGGVLPMITSCSPGWVKYCEHNYPELLPNISSCKSPNQMMGAIVKNYFAKKQNIDPRRMTVVSVMPCTAKKYEIKRPESRTMHEFDGDYVTIPDVDISITTRELAEMIRESGIDFLNLEDSSFDPPFSASSGAAVLFGASGGVMEAALRTAYEIIMEQPLERVEFDKVRGFKGIKEAVIPLGDLTLNVAVVHGTGNAEKMMEAIKKGEKKYHFIEIMGCPGGCITGGGQPRSFDKDIAKKRAQVLYSLDRDKNVRKSHENLFVNNLYRDFLGKPNGELSHKLLHTKYTEREKYPGQDDMGRG